MSSGCASVAFVPSYHNIKLVKWIVSFDGFAGHLITESVFLLAFRSQPSKRAYQMQRRAKMETASNDKEKKKKKIFVWCDRIEPDCVVLARTVRAFPNFFLCFF